MVRYSITDRQQMESFISQAIPVMAIATSLASHKDPEERLATEQPGGTQYSATNGTQDFLVFFPIFGPEQEGRRNMKTHIERFVIQAWAHIAEVLSPMSSVNPSLRVVAMAEAQEHCYPEFENKQLSAHFFCVALPLRCQHPEFHIPTMDCIFSTAVDLALQNEVLLYANGDIIFQQDIFSIVLNIFEQLRDPNIVIVGQRTDIEELLPPTFSALALQNVTTHARRDGVRHSPYGLDYFIFRPEIFPAVFPPYLLGRWRWDNALMTAFVSRNNVVTGTYISTFEKRANTRP
jgi:hypothetical protein